MRYEYETKSISGFIGEVIKAGLWSIVFAEILIIYGVRP